MRITPQTMLTNALDHLSQHTSKLGQLQGQAVTGKKLELPSDAPRDLGRLLASKAQDERLEAYLAAMRTSRASLEGSSAGLQQVNDILGRAKTIAIEGSHSGNSPEALEVLAQQVDRLLTRLLDIANQKQGGRFLFAGAASQTQPFEVATTDAAGRPTSVRYLGAELRDAVPVTPGLTVGTLYSGSALFQSETGVDLFQTLIDLRDELRNVPGHTPTQQSEALSARLAGIEQARQQVLEGLGEQSTSLQQLEALESLALDLQLRAQETTTDLEAADMAQLVVEIQARENTLRLTLATSARLFDQSLLDFLR